MHSYSNCRKIALPPVSTSQLLWTLPHVGYYVHEEAVPATEVLTRPQCVHHCVCVVCPLVNPGKGPRRRLVCFYVVCPLVNSEKGPRGRLICLLVVCPLVHPKKGPRGRLVCLHVVCPLVHPENGPSGRLVCPLHSLSPGAP